VFPALAANTTVHVRGIRAVLEVVPAAGCQSGLKALDHSSSALARPNT
jgi:hypothetical protein